MPNSLRDRLSELASSFASNVLDAIRAVSLDELLAESSGPVRRSAATTPVRSAAGGGAARRRGRLPRRSVRDIAKVVERIVVLLKRHPSGLRAEQIRDELGLEAKELPRPLKEGLDGGSLQKSGQKRATTYFAKTASSAKAGRAASRRRGGRAASGARKTRPTPAVRAPAARSTPKKIDGEAAILAEEPAQET